MGTTAEPSRQRAIAVGANAELAEWLAGWAEAEPGEEDIRRELLLELIGRLHVAGSANEKLKHVICRVFIQTKLGLESVENEYAMTLLGTA